MRYALVVAFAACGSPCTRPARRVRGATLTRLPDLARGRASIRCHIHVAICARITTSSPHHPLETNSWRVADRHQDDQKPEHRPHTRESRLLDAPAPPPDCIS